MKGLKKVVAMIQQKLLKQLQADRGRQAFIYPDYGRYSIAEIPNTILQQFGVLTSRPGLGTKIPSDWSQYQKMVLFLVDGLGFDQWLKYGVKQPFFRQLSRAGEVYPLTSVFPSTTAAALTTIHSGLTPQEHGLPEWAVYFEEFDRIIETIPFRPYLTTDQEILLTMGGKPEMLYSGLTVYEQLAGVGVPSFIFIDQAYTGGTYSQATHRGATVVPFLELKELLYKLFELHQAVPGPAYFFVYWGMIDNIQHRAGPGSREHRAAIADLAEGLAVAVAANRSLLKKAETLFLVSADHGQAPIKGEEMMFLNKVADLESAYTKASSGQAICPTGSPHDVFLHIKQPKIKAVVEMLQEKLRDQAEVITTREAIKRGLFGLNKPSETFLRRIGQVLILPYEGRHVWYRHAPDLEYHLKGIHGGLSAREMLVPLAVVPLSRLSTS
jgi:predicted AlkP superfamily pyrophosphatase or phosphodiesterase